MAAIAHLEGQRGPATLLAMMLHPAGRRHAQRDHGAENLIQVPDSVVLMRAPRLLADASPFPLKPSAVNAI